MSWWYMLIELKNRTFLLCVCSARVCCTPSLVSCFLRKDLKGLNFVWKRTMIYIWMIKTVLFSSPSPPTLYHRNAPGRQAEGERQGKVCMEKRSLTREKYKKIISDLHFPSIHLNSLSIQTYTSSSFPTTSLFLFFLSSTFPTYEQD